MSNGENGAFHIHVGRRVPPGTEGGFLDHRGRPLPDMAYTMVEGACCSCGHTWCCYVSGRHAVVDMMEAFIFG